MTDTTDQQPPAAGQPEPGADEPLEIHFFNLPRVSQEQVIDAIQGAIDDLRSDLAKTRQALAAAEARETALRVAGRALIARSPFFVVIGTPDIECCQFCLEDGKHADDCPWLAFERALAAPAPAPAAPVDGAPTTTQAMSALCGPCGHERRNHAGDEWCSRCDCQVFLPSEQARPAGQEGDGE